MDSDKVAKLMSVEALASVVNKASNNEETVRVGEQEQKSAQEWRSNQNLKLQSRDLKNIEGGPNWENCDYETAINATGYGMYNVRIMAATVLPMFGCTFASSTMSLILPSAECELDLSNFHKGILNACIYIGMMTSAFFWGFLSDTLGRQRLIYISYGLNAFFGIITGLSQNFEILLTAKLADGFICAGPYAIMMSYLAECHSAEHRAKIIQWTGVFCAVGNIIQPLMAWVIIPQPWFLQILGLNLPSWRMFVILCATPALISAITFYFQDESPKFLMAHGRYDEAMQVFRKIYALNTKLPESTYPVLSLERSPCVEKVDPDEKKSSCLGFLSDGWLQMKPLFYPPHLVYAIMVFAFQGCTLFGLNTLRLWMPQLFSSIILNEESGGNATVSTVCELLVAPEVDETIELDCSVNLINSRVYINTVIIGAVTSTVYLLSSYIISAVGKKKLLIWCTFVSVILACSMYWSTSSNLMLAISSVYIAITSVTSTAIISVVVDLFPTSLRTMAVSLTMMFGRMGAMTGNLIFPLLLDWNCTVPFFLIAAVLTGAGLIATVIPKTKGKALE